MIIKFLDAKVQAKKVLSTSVKYMNSGNLMNSFNPKVVLVF